MAKVISCVDLLSSFPADAKERLSRRVNNPVTNPFSKRDIDHSCRPSFNERDLAPYWDGLRKITGWENFSAGTCPLYFCKGTAGFVYTFQAGSWYFEAQIKGYAGVT